MVPLDSTAILLQGVGGVLRAATQPDPGTPQRALRSAPEVPREARAPVATSRARPALSTASPEAIIRQAELLLQITATAASSPAMREIAAAAYQMEIDARRDMARARLEGMTAGRQWLA